MKVIVKLYATLTQNISKDILSEHPEGIRSGIPFEVTIPTGSTLSDLVTHLSLPEDVVKLTYVNGLRKEFNYQLQFGDQVGIFPPIAGG
jgi:molybdopterin converting factor small subunit